MWGSVVIFRSQNIDIDLCSTGVYWSFLGIILLVKNFRAYTIIKNTRVSNIFKETKRVIFIKYLNVVKQLQDI